MTLNRLHEIGTFCIKEIDNRLKRRVLKLFISATLPFLEANCKTIHFLSAKESNTLNQEDRADWFSTLHLLLLV